MSRACPSLTGTYVCFIWVIRNDRSLGFQETAKDSKEIVMSVNLLNKKLLDSSPLRVYFSTWCITMHHPNPGEFSSFLMFPVIKSISASNKNLQPLEFHLVWQRGKFSTCTILSDLLFFFPAWPAPIDVWRNPSVLLESVVLMNNVLMVKKTFTVSIPKIPNTFCMHWQGRKTVRGR